MHRGTPERRTDQTDRDRRRANLTGRTPTPSLTHKAMLEQATRAWSAEFGQQGIRVNTLAPGVILTEGSLPVKDHQELMARGFPAGRVGSPDDIAKAAVFLASGDASYMHGATLLVDGGALSTRLQ